MFTDQTRLTSIRNSLISGISICAAALLLSACQDAPSLQDNFALGHAQSEIQTAQNKMVVLPANMTLGAAVIHPPRSKTGFGSTENQTIGALNGLHNLLAKQNLNLGNVMRIRAVLTPNAEGFVDYDGYMRGFNKFFGTKKLPNVPLNIAVEAHALPVQGQYLIIEADLVVPVPTDDTAQPDADHLVKKPSRKL